MVDEQTDEVRFDGDVFAFTLSTQYARKVYRYADELRAAGKKVIIGGIHVIMLGLPHDTPERLARTLRYLKEVPCGLYDLRSLRLYPSTSLYREMLSRGKVTENYWLAEDQGAGNQTDPGVAEPSSRRSWIPRRPRPHCGREESCPYC